MEKGSANTVGNYTFTAGPTTPTVLSAVLQPNGTLGKQVLLTLNPAPAVTPGSSYTITVTAANVTDLNGNFINNPGNTFVFTGK